MLAQVALLSLAAFAPLVSAHGSISAAWIDGKYYPAPYPNRDDPSQFTIRAINDINPVKGTDNRDLNCGHGARAAGLVADAQPGSTVSFSWRNGEGGVWVHNTGPVMTYMAPCGQGGCVAFDPANAQFFKISELGKHADGNGWYMADLTTGPNATTSVTLPSNLPAGEYLIRHELIAMQLGMTQGGAEFYPACMQIRLSAPSRTAAEIPSGKEVVTFPGGYSDTDPGIWDPNVYNPGSEYIFPGPAIAAIASGDPSTGGSSDTNAPASTSSTGSSSTSSAPENSAPAPTATSGCGGYRKKKRVVKRIVRPGPLIKRHSKGSSSGALKRDLSGAPVKQQDWKRSPAAVHEEKPFVRSRVMRGI